MSDSDKLFMRGYTVSDSKPALPAEGNSWSANDLMLGRHRYTVGATALAQPDCEIGATWAGPDGCLWFYRIDGTATADDDERADLAAPIRAIWHYSDRNGAPETDGRSINGDLIIWDDGTNDRFLGVCTGSGVYGLGVRADYRTAATGTNSTTKRQPSDRVMMRGSSWDGAAAVTRDWSIRTVIDTSADGGDDWGLYFECRAGAGSWSSPLSFGRQGSFSFSGSSPCVTMNFTSGGSRGLIFGSAGTQADGQEFLFKHLGWSKLARFRFAGSTDERSGVNALALSAIYGSAATNIVTTVKSAALGGTASYWDGADPQEASWYDQLILTGTTPAGYLRRGFGFGPGTLDLHHYGRLALAGTTTLSGTLADGDAAQTTLTPTYDGAHTVTRHNYRKLANPTLTGSAVVTDACRDHYDAAAGTHKGLDAGSGGVDCYEKVNRNGTVVYGPLYAAKNAPPSVAYGEIFFSGGLVTSASVAQTLVTAATPQKLTGFDTDGSEAGCTCDAANDKITIDTTGIYRVSATVCLSGDAGSYLIGLIEANGGTPVNDGRTAEFTLAASESKAVTLHEVVTLTAGNDIEVWGFNVVDNGADIAIHDLILSIERVA